MLFSENQRLTFAPRSVSLPNRWFSKTSNLSTANSMKSNNLLTYLLYGLLAFFLAALGYYACQRQKEQKLKAQEEAELQKTLRDMGYLEEDTTATGSSFASESAPSAQTTTTKNGIETETATKPAPGKTTDKGTPTSPAAGAKTRDGSVATGTKPTTSSTTTTPKTTTPNKTLTAKGGSTAKGPGSGRWAVRAGTFSYMEGARRRLEEVIKLGYPNAEISKTSSGQAAVVVYRSNDKNAAIRVMDQLEEKGVDAAVFDRSKQ
jgi:cytoskeletal protein RodZ